MKTFEDREFLASIIKQGAKLTCKSDREPLYAENEYERFVASERWGLEPYQLHEFMKEAGDEYSYISPASFASSLYRKRFERQKNILQQGDYRSEMARNSLYGGRCEVYQSGVHHAISYDINSSYPTEARKLMFPVVRRLIYIEKPSLRNVEQNEGMSTVIYSQDGFRPILPIRHDGRTIYAQIERGEGTYTHIELRYAIEHGVVIHQIKKQYISLQDMDSPYSEFVDYCFRKRWETGIKTWKSIMNSFFGRLATLSNNLLRFRPATSHKELQNTPGYRKTYFGNKHKLTGIACVADVIPSPPNGNVLNAALILSSARIRIHDLCERHDALYVDTDGIISTRHIETGRNDELGALKFVKEGTFTIRGGKTYLYTSGEEEDIILKGKPKLFRTKADLLAARLTNERIKNEDNTTAPYQLSFITSDSR